MKVTQSIADATSWSTSIDDIWAQNNVIYLKLDTNESYEQHYSIVFVHMYATNAFLRKLTS